MSDEPPGGTPSRAKIRALIEEIVANTEEAAMLRKALDDNTLSAEQLQGLLKPSPAKD